MQVTYLDSLNLPLKATLHSVLDGVHPDPLFPQTEALLADGERPAGLAQRELQLARRLHRPQS